MTRDTFEKRIREARQMIEALPADRRGPLRDLVEETCTRYQAIGEATKRSLNALDDWRIIQKYIIFDAEAKAREAGGSQPGAE